MLLVPVVSENLSAMGWDQVTSELQVQFRSNGSIYSYPGVPEEVYAGLASAPSKGTFFDQNIRKRPDLYPPTRIL